MNAEQTEIDFDTMTAVLPLQDGSRVFAELTPDSDAAAPWEDWDGEGRVHLFHRGTDGGAYLQERFDGDPEQVYRQLCNGEPVNDIDGQPCLGIEAYIHSGERWFLPGGAQIDRQWDVVSLRALWIADKDVLDNILEEPTPERLREYLHRCLSTFNQYLAGDVWCCDARLETPTDDPEIWEAAGEQESCCGLYGEEGIKDFMRELVGSAVTETA